MINTKDFLNFANKIGITFFTGVPDSLLKEFSLALEKKFTIKNHIIAANEGGAIGLAVGYNLATSKIPMVYLQNSGLGNIVNPVTSIADKNIFSIPMILMIGWRGEPGFKDEPQHLKQGEVTLKFLEELGIDYLILDKNINEACKQLEKLYSISSKLQKPVAVVVKKDSFSSLSTNEKESSSNFPSRLNVLESILKSLKKDDIIVSTTGKTSREIFQIKSNDKFIQNPCFYTIGGMGHCSQIALGISMQKTSKNIYCLDGDGSFIMHMGSNALTANYGSPNFYHIVLNNESHDSVGGQPTIANKLRFKLISEGLGYKNYKFLKSLDEVEEFFNNPNLETGPNFIEIKIRKGSSPSLGRPTDTPLQQKIDFINQIN